jgi:serine/threonine-protein kinase PknK
VTLTPVSTVDTLTGAPPRYEPIQRLGRGGGGEVWSVRDRISGEVVALKVLTEGAAEEDALALVREAVALSGLEGLGAPRVRRFGRLSGGGLTYLVRDLVAGESLAELVASPSNTSRAIAAVAETADQVTRLHRAELLHGDIKPANIIVGGDGVRLVDLGLAARFRSHKDLNVGAAEGAGGAHALGMTPRFAAPELLNGGPLTIRAEVFALGRTLRHVLDNAERALDTGVRQALDRVAAKATSSAPSDRYPSADEFAIAIRRAAGLSRDTLSSLGEGDRAATGVWPILGIDRVTDRLATQIAELSSSKGLAVVGPRRSGRTTLLRRVAWSLGVRDAHVAHVEARGLRDPRRAIEIEVAAYVDPASVLLLVDDFHELPSDAVKYVDALRDAGTRIAIVTSGEGVPELSGPTLGVFQVPPLEDEIGRELVRRSVPSLGEGVIAHIVRRAEGWPGRIREMVELVGGAPVVAAEDVDKILAARERLADKAVLTTADLGALKDALDRGHYDEAADLLERFDGTASLALGVARARLAQGRGEPQRALTLLGEHEREALENDGLVPAEWSLHAARALLHSGEYDMAEARGRAVKTRLGSALSSKEGRILEAEGESIAGLALAFLSRPVEAVALLETATRIAEKTGEARVLSVAWGSLGFVFQKIDKLDEARGAYEKALTYAEEAGDAGSVATTRLNLATLAKMRGELGQALGHFEAAVDMGRRSGRISTLRHALLNLANLDLYLGRYAKAATSIAALAEEGPTLPKQLVAQLLSLEAELADRRGDASVAREKCARAADAFDTLGHVAQAAEARLWSVLFSVDGPDADVSQLRAMVEAARPTAAMAPEHVALLELADGRTAVREGDLGRARGALDRAVLAAERHDAQALFVRALDARAELADRDGDGAGARRERERAVATLESVASALPPDLAEVFWNDDRRRRLRTSRDRVSAAPSIVFAMDRVARVLEINREIAGTYDLPRLLERVTDHAVTLVQAERGFVLLRSRRVERDGALSVHASRGDVGVPGDDGDPNVHARFSRSIAERVIASGEPVVTTSAREDARTAGYLSVHQLMLESIACVPIRSRTRGIIGALYLETRLNPGHRFESELPVLIAFADQAAIAIETAHLVSENERRKAELERANVELEAARGKLAEALDLRTAQLSATRKDLRTARAVIKGHFGYEGLVGTSDAMRRLYALIDRLKDTDVPVLISGESGTGKEMVARAIHNAGARAKRTFVGINCGAVPEHLLESELFGHVRGAFTGADRDRTGLFGEAGEGTLLLDEIGEMGPRMQAALLRVLQEKVVRPVGSTKEEPTRARVMAATHRDLATLVQEGKFREDLFYRLNVIPVMVPPLRERVDDIPILIDHFLSIFAARYSRDRRSVSRAALELLIAHRWPGNVRQLENVLLNAWVLSDAAELAPLHFGIFDVPPVRSAPPPSRSRERPPTQPKAPVAPASFAEHKNDERERIVAALASANWNRVKAAEIVGMPRRTFYRRLKEYGLQ